MQPNSDRAAWIERFVALLLARDTFGALSPAVLAQLVQLGTVLQVEPGATLLREGAPATPEIYLLIDGALVVQSQGRFIARLDRPGDVVGEVAVLLSARRNADVVAESAVRLLVLPAGVLARPEFVELAAGLRRAMLRDDWIEY